MYFPPKLAAAAIDGQWAFPVMFLHACIAFARLTKEFLKVTHPEGSSLWFYSTHPLWAWKVFLRVQISVDYHFSTVIALSVHRNVRCKKWINLPCVPGKNLTLLTKLYVSVMMLSNKMASLACWWLDKPLHDCFTSQCNFGNRKS